MIPDWFNWFLTVFYSIYYILDYLWLYRYSLLVKPHCTYCWLFLIILLSDYGVSLCSFCSSGSALVCSLARPAWGSVHCLMVNWLFLLVGLCFVLIRCWSWGSLSSLQLQLYKFLKVIQSHLNEEYLHTWTLVSRPSVGPL